MGKVFVKRTIEYVGEESWVDHVLSKSYLKREGDRIPPEGHNTVTLVEEKRQEVPDDDK